MFVHKVKINVDGKDILCDSDKTVLEVATENDIYIPTLCYIPLISDSRKGRCRLCLVEVLSGGRLGLQSSCTLPVSEGLTVTTNNENVFNVRRLIVELILSEHKIDCRNCVVSGQCNIAKLCEEYDIDALPVCAECPNQKNGCLLNKGKFCLGPITYGGCNAKCLREGFACEGCHGVSECESLLIWGIKQYRDTNISFEEVIKGAQIFSFKNLKLLRDIMFSEITL
jgi:predicted molibdopterin-dependent oxidoreductase YjgC